MMRFKNIQEFLQKYPCKFKATWVGEREDNLMRSGKLHYSEGESLLYCFMNHYKYVISRTDEKHPAMTGYYSQGFGIAKEPTLERVMECLRTDAIAGEMGFEEFCDEFGYDPDSRRAEAVHKACQKVYMKWIAMFWDLVELEETN